MPIPVRSVSLLRPAIIALVGVAAIVTPLGLYETIAPVQAPTQQDFHYIKDTSPIGLGTPPRTNTTWSRLCGDIGYMACPNSGNNITKIRNATGVYVTTDGFSSKIPAHVVEGFQRGLLNLSPSVSSISDIQYRSLTTRTQKETERQAAIDNGTAFNISAYRPLSTLVLSDDIGVYEGLIVDMKQGGLGFRNHTAPPWTRYGSTWTEDILFIEPKSVCVDTNLTLDFEIAVTPVGLFEEVSDLVLTDRGGFVNLNRTYPAWDRGDTQDHPELYFRAYRAAYLNDGLTMAFMNVTSPGNASTNTRAFRYLNSTLNKEFSLHWKNGETVTDFLDIKASRLQLHTAFGNISLVRLLCKGAGGQDYDNITNMVASCGLLYGAPRRCDGSASLSFDPGSSWTLPMFS
ncbi:hypothetical protein BU23DRAFT_497820, partial [Bimuria novae-zelandiae CBS 107.79]